MHFFFFFNDTATTEIYTLSLHDALPISSPARLGALSSPRRPDTCMCGLLREMFAGRVKRIAHAPGSTAARAVERRSEEHTSELQSRQYLVCRLLLEKKKKIEASSTQNTT